LFLFFFSNEFFFTTFPFLGRKSPVFVHVVRLLFWGPRICLGVPILQTGARCPLFPIFQSVGLPLRLTRPQGEGLVIIFVLPFSCPISFGCSTPPECFFLFSFGLAFTSPIPYQTVFVIRKISFFVRTRPGKTHLIIVRLCNVSYIPPDLFPLAPYPQLLPLITIPVLLR